MREITFVVLADSDLSTLPFSAGASRFGGASPDLPFHVIFSRFKIISTSGKYMFCLPK